MGSHFPDRVEPVSPAFRVDSSPLDLPGNPNDGLLEIRADSTGFSLAPVGRANTIAGPGESSLRDVGWGHSDSPGNQLRRGSQPSPLQRQAGVHPASGNPEDGWHQMKRQATACGLTPLVHHSGGQPAPRGLPRSRSRSQSPSGRQTVPWCWML